MHKYPQLYNAQRVRDFGALSTKNKVFNTNLFAATQASGIYGEEKAERR